jgi:hypothetical protein
MENTVCIQKLGICRAQTSKKKAKTLLYKYDQRTAVDNVQGRQPSLGLVGMYEYQAGPERCSPPTYSDVPHLLGPFRYAIGAAPPVPEFQPYKPSWQFAVSLHSSLRSNSLHAMKLFAF